MQGYCYAILLTRSKVGNILINSDFKICITSEYFLCIFFACLQGCSKVTVRTSKGFITCYIQRIPVVTVIAVTYSHNLVITFLQSIITLESKSKLAAIIAIIRTLCPVFLYFFDNSLCCIILVNYDANILDSLQSL